MTIGGVDGGGFGPDLGLEQLRRDNALADEVHDPDEDEPRIVGIPKRYQLPEDPAWMQPHS